MVVIKKNNTPEMDICEELGIEMLWSIGGDYKANSSSTLVSEVVTKINNKS